MCDLPIYSIKTKFLTNLSVHNVIILCGQTSCGKSTQIPKILYMSGYGEKGVIGLTQPRKIAAVALSNRIASELNTFSGLVGFQVRYNNTINLNTNKIKFMTDGILFREIQSDFLLLNYSVVIIDEVHERSIYTDLLLGLLSRIVELRSKRGIPLKLIIMSATLNNNYLNEKLFKNKPIFMYVPTRTFPINIHYAKKTPHDYVGNAFIKVCKIHQNLPAGGILVFLTGKQEVLTLCKRLTERFRSTTSIHKNSIKIYSLYSLLSAKKQAQIFSHSQNHAPNVRLCVVSTNVAETSLTIPGISYVVDCGKEKKLHYNDNLVNAGGGCFPETRIDWISQASADQRAGRCGREGVGHCYRLYTLVAFHSFNQYSQPEILNVPLDGMVLNLKSLHIDRVQNFPFPTSPPTNRIYMAYYLLCLLGLIHPTKNYNQFNVENGKLLHYFGYLSKIIDITEFDTIDFTLTHLGEMSNLFPLHPRYAKLISSTLMVVSTENDSIKKCYTLALALSSALTVRELFEKSHRNLQSSLIDCKNNNVDEEIQCLGDVMTLFKAIGALDVFSEKSEGKEPRKRKYFCKKLNINSKSLNEFYLHRKHIHSIANRIDNTINEYKLTRIPQPIQLHEFRKLLCASAGFNIAKRMSLTEQQIKALSHVKPKINHYYECLQPFSTIKLPSFISSSSVLCEESPHYIVFQDAYIEKTNITLDNPIQALDFSRKICLKYVCSIEPQWLFEFYPTLCSYTCDISNNNNVKYDSDIDDILCSANVQFSSLLWPLGCFPTPLPSPLKPRFMARYFLEGILFPKLLPFTKLLLIPLENLLTNTDQEFKRFINQITENNVHNKKQIIEKWKIEPKFLLIDYIKFIPQSFHNLVQTIWPPI